MKGLLEWLDQNLIALALACFGASVQCLRGTWHGWANFLISNLMAAFSAIICMLILPHYLDFELSAGITGIVGYSGGTLIDALLDRMRREIETRKIGGSE